MVRDLVEDAAQIANELARPDGLSARCLAPTLPLGAFLTFRCWTWKQRGPPRSLTSIFAKSRLQRLYHADGIYGRQRCGPRRRCRFESPHADEEGFAKTQLRQVLFAVLENAGRRPARPEARRHHARGRIRVGLLERRQKLIGLAEYIAAKTSRTRLRKGRRARACRGTEARPGMTMAIERFSSRREALGDVLTEGSPGRSRSARIAGYFRSSSLEVVGEA